MPVRIPRPLPTRSQRVYLISFSPLGEGEGIRHCYRERVSGKRKQEPELASCQPGFPSGALSLLEMSSWPGCSLFHRSFFRSTVGADGYPAEVDQGRRLRVRVVPFSDTSPLGSRSRTCRALATTRSRESAVVKGARAVADQS